MYYIILHLHHLLHHSLSLHHPLPNYHRDPLAADPLHLALALRQELLTVQQHRAAQDAGRGPRREPQDREARHALPRPRLTDEAQRLALGHAEGHAVDSPDRAPARDETGLEVPDLDDRRRHARRPTRSPLQRCASGSRPRPSRARTSPTTGASANPWPEKPAATSSPSVPGTGPSIGSPSGVKASMPAQRSATTQPARGG